MVQDWHLSIRAGKKRRRSTSSSSSSSLSLVVAATAIFRHRGQPHHHCTAGGGMKSIVGVVASASRCRRDIASHGRRINPGMGVDHNIIFGGYRDVPFDGSSTAFALPTNVSVPSTRGAVVCLHPRTRGDPSRFTDVPNSRGRSLATWNSPSYPLMSSPPRGDEFIDDRVSEMNDERWSHLTSVLDETFELPAISVPANRVHRLLSDGDSPLRPYLASTMIELAGVHPKIKMVREDDDCAVPREEGGRSRTYGGGEDDASSNDSMGARKMRKRILLDSGLARGRVIDDASDDVPSSRDDDNDDDDDGDGDGDSKEGSLSVLARRLPGVPYHVLRRLVYDHDAMPGRVEIVRVSYQNQPISRILSKVLPHGEDDDDDDDDDDGASRRQPPPSSYEQIGHVAHFNLRGTHVPYGRVIGRVMLDRLRPTIRTVVNKVGEVGGPYRTYDMDLLAGDDDYFVRVIEHGAVLEFDLRNVYWCTRLEGERTHMIRNVFRPKQLIADAFCGVGALCIRARVELGCDIVANDLNPDAASYCAGSARRNGIRVGGGADDDDDDDDGRFRVRCGDAREFIMNLGIGVTSAKSANPPASSIGGVEDDDDDDIVAPTVKLPDHLLLNFPLDSPKFLNALRWWPSGGDRIDSPPTRVHVYTFSRGDDERNAMDVAIDMVADGLLPEGGYVEPTKFRGGYLDELGCNVHAREIRDAAPGKSVICVSFSVTRLLLRRMQGDYGLI